MSFYKNIGVTDEVKAEILAEKLCKRYLEDLNEYRRKKTKYIKSSLSSDSSLVSEIYLSLKQKQGSGTRIWDCKNKIHKNSFKEHLKNLFLKGYYLSYKDKLTNKWHMWHKNFDLTK